MPRGEDDIYAVEFKDIYEIEFDVVDTGVPQSTGEETGTQEAKQDNNDVTESQATLVPKVETGNTAHGTQEIVPVMGRAAINLSSQDIIVSTKDTPDIESVAEPELDVPTELQTLASDTISKLVENAKRPLIPFGALIKSAFDRKLTKPEKAIFIEALKRDGRIEYFKDGTYLIIERSQEVVDSYLAGNDPLAETTDIKNLIEELLPQLIHQDGHITHKGVFGAISRLGIYLNAGESHEFMRLFTSYPGVIAQPNGNFILANPNAELNRTKNEAPKEPEFTEGVYARDGKPIPSKIIKNELRSEGALLEWRAARPANPRRKKSKGVHHSKKLKGRTHGHTKTFDELVKDMEAKDDK